MKTTEEQRAELRRLADSHSVLKWPQLINLLDDFAALEAENARLKEEIENCDTRFDAIYAKFEGCPHKPINAVPGIGVVDLCGCSFDAIGDVCAHHAPALRKTQQERDELKAQVEQLVEDLVATASSCMSHVAVMPRQQDWVRNEMRTYGNALIAARAKEQK